MKNKYQDVMFYKVIRPIVTFLFTLLFRPKIIGKDNIPKTGAIIIAGNHTHWFDCLLLISSTNRCIHFLAKKDLFNGVKRIIFNNLGLISVNRQEKDHNALVTAENYLKNNKVIGIFPEGTISKEKGQMLPLKMGAIKIAKDTNTKIVPFAITGNYKLFSKDLIVKFGKPMEVKNDNLEIEKENLKENIMTLMKH